MSHEQARPTSESLEDLARIYGVHVILLEQALREERTRLDRDLEWQRDRPALHARDQQREDEERSRRDRIEAIRRDERDREERARRDRDQQRQDEERVRLARIEADWYDERTVKTMNTLFLAGQEQERNRRLADGRQLDQEEAWNSELIRNDMRIVIRDLDVSTSLSKEKASLVLQVCSYVPSRDPRYSSAHPRYVQCWHEAWSWPQPPNVDEFTRVVTDLLQNPKYFTRCECCERRRSSMFVELEASLGRSICWACQENYLGVRR